MKGINQGSIRLQNLYRFFDVLHKNPGITRKEIAQCTGLSLMTVSNLVDFLERNEAISISQNTDLKGPSPEVGRKAGLARLDSHKHVWFFIDLTEVYFSFYGFTLNIEPVFDTVRFEYDKNLSYKNNLLIFLSNVRKMIDNIESSKTVIGIAVGVPGPYNANSDTVKNVRIPQMNNLKITELLNQSLGHYVYYIDEDVKFSIRAYVPLEWTDEAAVQYYLYIGIGVGGAAVVGNHVLKGLHSVAGDIGQINIHNNETFEQLVSLRTFAFRLGVIQYEQDQDLSENELLDLVGNQAKRFPDVYQKVLNDMIIVISDMLHIITWMLSPSKIIIDCKYALWSGQNFATNLNDKLCSLIDGRLPSVPKCELAFNKISPMIIGSYQTIIYGWLESLIK